MFLHSDTVARRTVVALSPPSTLDPSADFFRFSDVSCLTAFLADIRINRNLRIK